MLLLLMFLLACCMAATIHLWDDAQLESDEELSESEQCKCIICRGPE